MAGDISHIENVAGSKDDENHILAANSEQASVDAYVERRRTRQKAFETFRREFELGKSGQISTFITNGDGEQEKLIVRAYPNEPKIESTDLDREVPIHFAPTSYSFYFERIKPQPSTPPEDKIEFSFEDSLFGDYPRVEELDEKANKDLDSPEKIKAYLQKKFADLGLQEIPIIPYSLRLIKEDDYVKLRAAIEKADVMMPLYRSLEIKRLLADPTSADSNYLKIATQRQHVYNQIMDVLRDTGMDVSQITLHMMEGVFDSVRVAGVPVFTDDEGDKYLVIDCEFGGYDEQNPEGADFSGKVVDRSTTDVAHILEKAEERGYTTRFYGRSVSGGPHQHWYWHGIKIDGFDRDHLENNLPKILKILQDVGIDPEKAATPMDVLSVSDLYMR